MKYIASGAAGFLLASLVFMFVVVPQVRQNWRTQGQTEGALSANADMHKRAAKSFPEKVMNCTFVETLGGAKPQRIDIVDCGAYKTLRITE
jgi:hypothetical protein